MNSEGNHRGTRRKMKRYNQDSVKLCSKILLLSLFIVGCDLFNGPVQPDFLKKIDEEIAWSNAAKLDVRVDYNPLWGSSPQQGALDRETHRQGYAFNVEFTPAPGYGFVGWFAFRTNGLDLTNIDTIDIKEALNDNDANIVRDINAVGGTLAYKVTINITDPVTLVPLCSDRPRLSQQTNPPLNQILMSFPYDQRVSIWFTMNINRDTVKLGDTIVITGINLNKSVHGERGQPFEHLDGDEYATGDLTNFYEMVEEPDSGYNPRLVTLVPKEDHANKLRMLNISVTVGPGIRNEAGDSMAQAEVINFLTDSSKMQSAYRTTRIEAKAARSNQWFGDNNPFNNPTIDRRFSPDEGGDAPVITVKFTTDMLGGVPPNKINIIEHRAYTLNGTPVDTEQSSIPDKDRGTDCEFTIDGTGIYTVYYQLQTPTSGIIRLLVRPWDSPNTPPLSFDDAIAEGQYVTIVLDADPPGLTGLSVQLSTPSTLEGKSYIYAEAKATEGITVTLENLKNITHNTQGDISPALAWNLPWTMKEEETLYWEIRIGDEESAKTKTSNQLEAYEGSEWTLEEITDLIEAGFPVYVRFKDSFYNTSDWIDTEYMVRYLDEDISPVTNLRAVCNDAGTSITVTWEKPPGTDYYEPKIEIQTYRAGATGDVLVPEGEIKQDLDKTTNNNIGTHSFNVSQINSGGVLNGNAVSGVFGYEITVINACGAFDAKVAPVWVYNIQGMDSTATNTIRITSDSQLTINNSDLGKNIVLTRDITVNGNHTPISTFTGKFYGNGHTVTVSGMDNFSANLGLFGSTANQALIRDLAVVYGNNATVSVTYRGTEQVYIGGITGRANDTTQISNCLVKGALNVTSTLKIHAGGIVGGLMHTTAQIENGYSGINLFVEENGNSIICAGGIAGQIWSSANANVDGTNKMINKATAAGNVTAINNGTGSIYLGGIAGECTGLGTIEDTVFSGTLVMIGKSTTGSSNYICGGIIGRMQEGNITKATVTGRVTIPYNGSYNHSTSRETLLGGVVGTAGHDRATASPTNTADITITNAKVVNTPTTPAITDNEDTGVYNIYLRGNTSGTITTGGVCAASSGSSGTKIVFKDCEYDGGSASIRISNTYSEKGNIGGFIGDVKQNTSFINCGTKTNANATGISINCYPGTATTITLNAGGFAGNADTPVFNGLYSNCPINVTIRAFQNAKTSVGGFVGYQNGGSIDKCFARGSVTVNSEHTNETDIRTGGFGGRIEGEVTIDNSYARGDVRVHKSSIYGANNGILRTGGFVGSIGILNSSSRSTVQHSFSAGQVVSLFNIGGTGRWNHVGGFAGELWNTDIDRCVVLSGDVYAQGGNTANAFRFLAYNSNATLKHHFANSAMRCYGSPTYSTTLQTGSTVTENGDKQAWNVPTSDLNSWSFWGRAVDAGNSNSGPGFSNTVWNSSDLSRGFPLLRDVGGQL